MIVSRHLYHYSPALCVRELVQLHEAHSDRTALSVIGMSHLGQPLYALRMGNPYADTRVLIQASMHGREWINTQLVMAQMEDYLSEEKYAEIMGNMNAIDDAQTGGLAEYTRRADAAEAKIN